MSKSHASHVYLKKLKNGGLQFVNSYDKKNQKNFGEKENGILLFLFMNTSTGRTS